jgi:hypothetical protein
LFFINSFDIIITDTTCPVFKTFTSHLFSNTAGVGSNQAIASISHRFLAAGSVTKLLCSTIHRLIFFTSVFGSNPALISSSIAILWAAAQKGIATVFPFSSHTDFMSDPLGTYKDTLLYINLQIIVQLGFLLKSVAAG